MNDQKITAAGTLYPKRWLALPVILTAAFLSVLDFFIVNISIAEIRAGLGASYADVEFVITAYGISYAIFMITGGRLGDLYGRKKMFISGMAGFTAASALCGLAATPGMLIAARIFQGVFAALMVPQGLAIIQVTFPPREKSAAFSIFGTGVGIAAIAGQILGGVLIDLNLFGLGWRTIFLVNVPVGILSITAAFFLIPESRAGKFLRLDIPGVILVTLWLLLFTVPLVEGRETGWPAWSIVSLLASFPVLAGFVLFERKKYAAHGYALIEPGLFRERAFVVGLLIVTTFFGGLSSFFLTLSLTLQNGFHFTALETGLTFCPFAAGFCVSSAASAKLAPRWGSRIFNVGSAVMIAGLALLLTVMRSKMNALDFNDLVPVMFFYGLGQGCMIAPLFNIVLSEVKPHQAGSASGILSTVQQIAAAVGVALIGIIYFSVLDTGKDAGTYYRAFSSALCTNFLLLTTTFILAFFLPRKINRTDLPPAELQ